MDAYLSKPIQRAELARMFETIFENEGAREGRDE
jgi:hypothetical protein